MWDICYYICLRDIICLACFIFNSIGALSAFTNNNTPHTMIADSQWNDVWKENHEKSTKWKTKRMNTNKSLCSSFLPMVMSIKFNWHAENGSKRKKARNKTKLKQQKHTHSHYTEQQQLAMNEIRRDLRSENKKLYK